MSTSAEVAQNISIIYFVVYGSVFLVASIYSAYEVEKSKHILFTKSNKSNLETKSNLSTAIQLNEIETKEASSDQNELEQKEPSTVNKDETIKISKSSCCKRFRKFMKYWAKSLWIKKSVYISIVPHLFDQATDIGVIYQYHEIWQNPDLYPTENNTTNMMAIFFSSVFVIIIHKIISCAAIFAMTRKCGDLFLQLLDLMMVKAIYLNYKYESDEPGNAQRFLQILEATFESAPQIVLSMIFILKTQSTDLLVYVSVISSLWTLVSRVKNDDKTLLHEKWHSLELKAQFKYNPRRCWPFKCNWRYIFRVICWRFLEITSRVFLICIMWLGMGGFAVIIIIGFELCCSVFFCFYGEGVIILGNMMYFTASAVGAVPSTLLRIAEIYKLLSPFLYLTVATCFSMIPFEAWKVPDYVERHKIVQDGLILSMFIYTWIASVLWIAALYVVQKHGFLDESYSSRNVVKLCEAKKYDELVNLIGFGGNPISLYPFMGQIISDCTNNVDKDKYKIILFQLLFEGLDKDTAYSVATKGTDDCSCLFHAFARSQFLFNYLLQTIKNYGFDMQQFEIDDTLDSSQILTNNEIKKLRKTLDNNVETKDDEKIKFYLLFRYSRDQLIKYKYNKYYFDEGETMTIFSTEKNQFIGGGYTSIPWKIWDDYVSDANAFMFAMPDENGERNVNVFKPTRNFEKKAVKHCKDGSIQWGRLALVIYPWGKVLSRRESVYDVPRPEMPSLEGENIIEYEVYKVLRW